MEKPKAIVIKKGVELIDRNAFMRRMENKIYRITVTSEDQEIVLYKDITYAEMFSCLLEEPVIVPEPKIVVIRPPLEKRIQTYAFINQCDFDEATHKVLVEVLHEATMNHKKEGLYDSLFGEEESE